MLFRSNRRNARSIYRHFWTGATRSCDGFDAKSKALAHVSQKPVNLMAWCIEHARIGLDKVVLDPYMGAGSTGVAALLSGRGGRCLRCSLCGSEAVPQPYARDASWYEHDDRMQPASKRAILP